MAGDWFPLQYWRSRCPEVVRVSSATGRSRHEVLGWICDFWSWVSTESADGRMPGIRLTDLVEILGADAKLWEAFRAVGWIGEDAGGEDGAAGIVVPGWDVWLCESGKKRMKDAQRKRFERAGGGETGAETASAKRPRSVPKASAKSPPTEQNRREEEDPPNPPQPGGVGESAAPAGEDTLPAIAEVTGLDPVTAAKKLRPAAEILAQADPPYTPAEVREFGRRFRELCPWAVKQRRDRPTPKELAERIGLVRSKRGPPKNPRSFAGNADEILANRRREKEEAERAAADLAEKGIVKLGSLFDRPPGGPE
jgi:hypothetical protein